MNFTAITCKVLNTCLLAALACCHAQAQTPGGFLMIKESGFWQSAPGVLVADEAFAEAGIVGVPEGSIGNPMIVPVTGGASALLWNPYDSGYLAWSGVTTALDLDARYPNGIYRITGTGLSGLGDFDVRLSLMGTYPDPPLVTNYAQLRQAKPQEAVTIQWDPFVSAAPHRFIELEARMTTLDEPIVYNPGSLSPDTVAHTIPANTFPANAQIQVSLHFVAASQFGEDTGPGGATEAAAYAATTSFRYPAPSEPPVPAIAFFGRDLFSYPGSEPNKSQWYFSFTFKNIYHFEDDNWFYFEPFNAFLWVDIYSGTLARGFWAYAQFPDGQPTWIFLGRNGNFGDLRDTPAGRIPDSAAGAQTLSGYMYLERPLPGDPQGPQWYYFSEFADGNYMINLGIPNPTPQDWHKLR